MMCGGEQEKLKYLARNKKGISTVIATIIIVAISIVMAIAVAYWALGIGTSFTRFERLSITSAWVETNSTGFTIHMILNNTGTAPASIDTGSIMYNGKPASAYLPASPQANLTIGGSTSETLQPGDSLGNVQILLPTTTPKVWKSGMSLEVAIQTSAGNNYPKTVQLP